MGSVIGLTRESSDTIGFVLASLFSSAIDLEELREWCYQIIGKLDAYEAPSYLFDLAEYKGALAGIYKILGFVPNWKHSAKDRAALFGIALRRGKSRFEWPVEKGVAMTALADSSEIERRFRETFPSIAF